jgi:tRNA G46 methylase TrmB
MTFQHDPSGWTGFYQGRDPAAYQSYCGERYKPFLALVGARLGMADPDEQVSFELGIGAGTITAILAEVYPRAGFVGVDVNEGMLDMAIQRIKTENLILLHQDARAKPTNPNFRPTVVHSHGLLEHFSDADARTIVDHYRDHYQVHYIPGLYPEPSYGDERLLPLDHWVKALRPSRAYRFNDGLDYALVFHPRSYH